MVQALAPLVGKYALWRVDSNIEVWVRVADAREMFGRQDLKVEPMEGHGHKWVSRDMLNSFVDAADVEANRR